MDIEKYTFWDFNLSRWDITDQAIIEQCDPKVRAIIDAVFRSWFIPTKATQLRLLPDED